MFEQNFENEERYMQQGRRPHYSDRRITGRGYQSEDDRYEDRQRGRSQDSERRYTRPDYDSELDIERPGQARFGSARNSYDFGRDYDQNSAWSQPSFRPQPRFQDRMSDSHPRNMDYGRGDSYSRDFQNSNIGHADWNNRFDANRFNGDSSSWNRYSSDQNQQSQHHFNDQKSRWPKSYKRTDDRIKDDIHEELIRHGRIDASEIEVQVKDGEITLTGQVLSRQDKRLVEDIAEKVLGAQEVHNQLRVSKQQTANDQKNTSSTFGSGSNRMATSSQPDQSTKTSSSSSLNK